MSGADVVSLLVSLQDQINQFHQETKAFIVDTNKSLEQLKTEQRRITEEVYTLRKELRGTPVVPSPRDDLLANITQTGSPQTAKHHVKVVGVFAVCS